MRCSVSYIFLLVLIFAASGCSRNKELLKDLQIAESLMTSRSDSALAILQPYERVRISPQKVRAYYALLYTQARDKNYIDDTNDSLISIAVNYYSKKNDYERLFVSLYYLGRIYENSGQFDIALLTFTRAEQLTGKVNNDNAKGLLYSRIARMYISCYDYNKAVGAYKSSIACYEKTSNEINQHRCEMNLAYSLIKLQKFDEAEGILLSCVNWASSCNNLSVLKGSLGYLAFLYESNKDLNKLSELYLGKYANYCKRDITYDLSMAFNSSVNGDAVNTKKHFQDAWAKAKNCEDSAHIYYMEYRAYKHLGYYKQSLERFELLFSSQDSLVKINLQQPLIAAQSDYYRIQSENNALLVKNQRLLIWVISSVALLLIILAVVIVSRYYRMQKDSINSYLDLATELQEKIYTKDSIIASQEDSISKMSSQIGILFGNQYRMLDKLSTIYYDTKDTRIQKDTIYNDVKKEIKKWSSNHKSFIELEIIVNDNRNGAMEKFRLLFPDLKQVDYRMFCLIFAGFSAKAISVFTNISYSNIYTKKHRIKERLQKEYPEQYHDLFQYFM